MRIYTPFILAALASLASAAEPETKPMNGQGITGQVIKLTGNFMPQVGNVGDPPPANRGRREVLHVPVHVFRGRVEPFDKPNDKHPQLVTIAKPDKNGVFRLPLAAGEYTVVAEIDGKLYLNLLAFADGKPHWGTVTVNDGAWTTTNIEDTSDAAF